MVRASALVAMSHGSSWDPTHDFYPDRSIFVGNATHIECAPDDDYSEPAIVLAAGSAMGALLLFLMWLSSGLGEASTGERPLATNHFGQFFLIPPFFLAMGAVIGWRVIDCTLGCSSWAESAPSISFFTANVMFEGYVLLFIMLVLIAYIFFERVDEMARNRVKREAESGTSSYRYSSLSGEWLMRMGFALTTFTGIMPSLAGNCHMQPDHYYEYCYTEVMSSGPHTIGIAGGIFLTFCGYQLRAAGPIATHVASGTRNFSWQMAFLTLLMAEITFGLMLCYFITWGYFLTLAGPNTKKVDTCILHTTEAACTGADLPQLQQQWADQRAGGWRCRWDPNVDFYLYPCTKFNCDAGGRVTQNKYSVIFEYLGFLYWAIACAGMTQAIDVMDDTPAETKMKAFVKKQRGTAAKKRAGSITPARGYTALS